MVFVLTGKIDFIYVRQHRLGASAAAAEGAEIASREGLLLLLL